MDIDMGLNMKSTLVEKKYKANLCRKCGEFFLVTWDKECSASEIGIRQFDIEWDWHKVFCDTYRIVSEIQEMLKGIK